MRRGSILERQNHMQPVTNRSYFVRRIYKDPDSDFPVQSIP